MYNLQVEITDGSRLPVLLTNGDGWRKYEQKLNRSTKFSGYIQLNSVYRKLCCALDFELFKIRQVTGLLFVFEAIFSSA